MGLVYLQYFKDEPTLPKVSEATVDRRDSWGVGSNSRRSSDNTLFSRSSFSTALTNFRDDDSTITETIVDEKLPLVSNDSPYSLSRDSNLLLCNQCYTQVCQMPLIISDNFHGKHGKAYLVSHLLNVDLDEKPSTKIMLTGEYLVTNVYCKQCQSCLGWKYLESDSRKENYKVGKFVIELELLEEVSAGR
ncbi:BA75_01741T0 [Komagataella pastoris]|uniref:BA75_01741T0 n=1 Tax=Komagataella pastoris TaxID=4922 RepID=A0A1B2J6K1_PICPA|nr:BA75_01741T0 [Komagataella pastoris]